MADKDLFDEEGHMVRMTFGEHLEDLRRRLILALLGLIPAVIIGLCIGRPILKTMKEPAENALLSFYVQKDSRDAAQLEKARELGLQVDTKPLVLEFDWEEFRKAIDQAKPEMKLSEADPDPDGDVRPKTGPIKLTAQVASTEVRMALGPEILARMRMITLNAQESFMAYMMVSIVTGLVLSSWWVIYQLWQFVAEGLYKKERRIVYRAMPMSVGLFLVGVAFCFYIVLPVVLTFFFGFNEWFDIEPNIRLSEWLSFATILPVIFGICFELPLVMLVLESVGIMRIDDYISKWRHAILVLSIVAMVVTPTTDPGSMMLLLVPMGGLYFLGIGLVQMRRGGLRALSPTAKLRAVVGILVTLYLTGVSIGFAIPGGWLSHDWWLDQVWRPGTIPTSWILRSWLESPSQNWMWGVTLLNAGVFGWVILRLGELVLGGGLRALTPAAKLRAVVGILVTLYLIGVSIGFAVPEGWINHDWWLDEVWRPGTLPTSWILRSWLESPSQNWMLGVTLLNAGVFGLVILRIGELVLRLVGRRSPNLVNEPKPDKGHNAGEQP